MPQRPAWLAIHSGPVGRHHDAHEDSVKHAGQGHARYQRVLEAALTVKVSESLQDASEELIMPKPDWSMGVLKAAFVVFSVLTAVLLAAVGTKSRAVKPAIVIQMMDM